MARPIVNDLLAFRAVAREQSFTRAAAQIGVSRSALSHTIRGLEERIGVRLLTRTTRSVSATEAGERLLATIGPRFDEIETELAAIGELSGKPSGTIRITTSEHAAQTVLWPVVDRFLRDFPEVQIELNAESGLSDIVAERFDAGVRLGEQIAKDMIAVRIGPPLRMTVVGSPDYLAAYGKPETPHDLADHRCINLRMISSGGLYIWEFEKDGRAVNVRVDGQITLNTAPLIQQAVRDGHGLAYLMADRADPMLRDGSVLQVLEDWCPEFDGYHLYYTSRRQPTQAFALLVEALRHHRI